ncbi:MAG: DUF4214 domain-containing protein [Geobacter sp.]|nr:DUF4214 domain-containing protein [Geobacter sp.]
MTVPLMGVSWPKSNTTPAIITYSLAEDRNENLLRQSLTDYPDLVSPLESAQSQLFQQALEAWEQVANVDFVLVGDTPFVDMRVGLSQIDGAGRILGIASLWNIGAALTDVTIEFDAADMLNSVAPESLFYKTALHEIGHVLGLDHSSNPSDLMYPYVNQSTTLSNDDKAAVVGLYGAAVTRTRPELPQTPETQVQKCYIAYYGRPADPGGLQYWTQQLEHNQGNLDSIIGAFAASPESQALYGSLDSGQVITRLYNQLFSRDPEPDGLRYWSDQLTNGTLSRQDVMLSLLEGAQNSDGVVVANKLAAATLFSDSGISGYGTEDLAHVRTWLEGVTTAPVYQESVDAAIAAMGINLPATLIDQGWLLG